MRWLAVCVVVLACASDVRADPAAAAATAKDAEKLGRAGDYPGAAAKFRAAYRLDPRPQYLCNVGVAYYNGKDLPRAQLYLADCLAHATALDEKLANSLRGALGGVESELRAGAFAALDISVEPAGASVVVDSLGPTDALAGAHLVWVPVGARSLTASATGYTTRTVTVDAKPGGRAVRVVLEKARADGEVATGVPVRPAPVEIQHSRSKAPAIATSIAALAAGGAALYAILHARSIMDDADSTTITHDEYDHLVARGHRWQYASWGIAGGAVVLGGVSGYLWYRATRSDVTLEVQPGASGGGSVLVGGRF